MQRHFYFTPVHASHHCIRSRPLLQKTLSAAGVGVLRFLSGRAVFAGPVSLDTPAAGYIHCGKLRVTLHWHFPRCVKPACWYAPHLHFEHAVQIYVCSVEGTEYDALLVSDASWCRGSVSRRSEAESGRAHGFSFQNFRMFRVFILKDWINVFRLS